MKTLVHRLEAYATFVVSKLPFAIQYQRTQIRLCPQLSELGVLTPCIVLHQHFRWVCLAMLLLVLVLDVFEWRKNGQAK